MIAPERTADGPAPLSAEANRAKVLLRPPVATGTAPEPAENPPVAAPADLPPDTPAPDPLPPDVDAEVEAELDAEASPDTDGKEKPGIATESDAPLPRIAPA